MALHFERDCQRGPAAPNRPPNRVVLLHGFAQTARCWGAVADDLAADHELLRIDAPGHGGSASVEADLDQGARLISEVGGAGTYIGYSMGARFALHVALRHPEVVSRLVLIGGTPGIEDAAERVERRERDMATAARIRREGVDDFLATWFDQPLFATLPPEGQFLHERRRNTADGLARSLEVAGTGSQQPLWPELERLQMPVLTVAGELDERYAKLAKRMADEIGDTATAVVIPGAGHAAHLEAPAGFLTALRSWLTG